MKKTKIKILTDGINRALSRYNNPEEPHNRIGGFPRSALGWSMANDLKETLEKIKE